MDKVPVQSPAGFHVVKVEDVPRPAELYPKYEARKEELRHILLQRKVQAFIHEQVLRAGSEGRQVILIQEIAAGLWLDRVLRRNAARAVLLGVFG